MIAAHGLALALLTAVAGDVHVASAAGEATAELEASGGELAVAGQEHTAADEGSSIEARVAEEETGVEVERSNATRAGDEAAVAGAGSSGDVEASGGEPAVAGELSSDEVEGSGGEDAVAGPPGEVEGTGGDVEGSSVAGADAGGDAKATRAAARVARRTRFAESAPVDVVGGGSRAGTWAGAVQIGYPWQTLRLQVGAWRTLTPLVELEAALFRRFRPAVGLGLRWVDRPRVRLTGDVLLGWFVQLGELARRGPNAELRLRLAFPSGRVAPYLMLATRHTLLFDRTRVISPGGTTTSWSARHDWTPWATLGLAIVITDAFGIELGIDWPWVGAPDGVAIPGVHLGALFGGGR
ncbi:MAG: hypothetical protein H6713_35130 [Myxococcales bacterium]|nr:hypothetical protein [Myxococcales bacterium]